MTLDTEMRRRMSIMLICVGILFGAIFIYKAIMGMMMKYQMSKMSHAVTVSTANAEELVWPSEIKAVGGFRAVQGVDITTELAGMVKTIHFTPGAIVKKDDPLVQLNADAEIGQLTALQASLALANITYQRDKAQYKVKAVSKQTLDSDEYNYKNLQGQVAQQAATVAKKTLRAAFNGRLGISYVNPGQYINTGDKVVTLQSFDPIYIDFYIPQQEVSRVKVDQNVSILCDAFPGREFKGKITTVEPNADTNTRNVKIEATIPNINNELMPGMFGNVTIDTGVEEKYITLPQTAVSFNPYGDIVFIVKKTDKKSHGEPVYTVSQSFVVTGKSRGDQVAILDGLKLGETVVTSGQLKLKNGSVIAINNKVEPSNNPHPNLPNEHEG